MAYTIIQDENQSNGSTSFDILMIGGTVAVGIGFWVLAHTVLRPWSQTAFEALVWVEIVILAAFTLLAIWLSAKKPILYVAEGLQWLFFRSLQWFFVDVLLGAFHGFLDKFKR